MGSIARFFKFLAESWNWVLKNFHQYRGSYVAFLLIGFFASIPWESVGLEPHSLPEIVSSLIAGLLSLVVIVNVVLIEKSRYKHRPKEELLYSVPTYLIYSLYSTLIILAGPGIILFIAGLLHLPQQAMIALAFLAGIVVGIYVAMVSLAAVLIDNDSVNYFKLSYRMARQDWVMVFCFGVLALLLEMPALVFDLIPDWRVVAGFNLLYSFFDAVATIVVTVASVRIFYYLKHQLNDQSQ